MDKFFKLGRLEFYFMNRMKFDDGDYQDGCGTIGYISWCYPSETIFIGRWELNIQNRRDPKKMYGEK